MFFASMLTCITQALHMFRFLPTSPIVCRLCSLINLLLSICVMHLCWLISPRPFICSDFLQCMPTWLTHTSITFLISICIYADLDHPDPFMCLDFLPSLVITHCMPTWLTHTSITFLIFMYLCWLKSPRPLHVFRFVTYITHCMLTWLTHTS